jgi:hypothetical protein
MPAFRQTLLDPIQPMSFYGEECSDVGPSSGVKLAEMEHDVLTVVGLFTAQRLINYVFEPGFHRFAQH